METKHCNNCDRTLPISDFGTYKRKSPTTKEFGKVRVYHNCKECKRRLDRERLKTNLGKERNRKACAKYQATKVRILSPKLKLKKYIETSAHSFFMYNACKGCGALYSTKSLFGIPKSGDYKCCKAMAFAKPLHTKQVQCNKCGVAHNAKNEGKMCNQCIKQAKKEYKNKTGKTRNHKKRCEKYGTTYDSTVRASLVYSRDKYTCYMCGVKCIKSKEYRKDMATIDHVIPISRGGGHTWDNVRTACMQCNTRKGIKPVHHAFEEKNKRVRG